MGARDTDRGKSERAGKCACVGREPEWVERGEADESERGSREERKTPSPAGMHRTSLSIDLQK